MVAYLNDIIPKIQRHSEKLDNITLLTNKNWIVFEQISDSKIVYIFRTNNDLLISNNGIVEKAKWEHLGNNSLLIDKKDGSYLFRQGFFDDNILALMIDGKNEYALLINETKYDRELNTLEKIIEFLTRTYLDPQLPKYQQDTSGLPLNNTVSRKYVSYNTDKGEIAVEQKFISGSIDIGDRVFKDNSLAPDGKYKIDFMYYIHILNGKVDRITLL